MKLTEIEILGSAVEIHVTERGLFKAYLLGQADGEDAKELSSAGTYDDVIERAKPAIRQRRVKVSVPFFRLRGHLLSSTGFRWESGVSTGFHSGTGNLLATINGRSEQLVTSGYRAAMVFRGDTPEGVRDEIVRLRGEIEERSQRLTDLDTEWQVELPDAVRKAIEAAGAEVS